MPILLETLQEKYTKDPLVINQIQKEFGNTYQEFEKEWDSYWSSTLIDQIINQSSNGNGSIAGAGPVDYNEGKIIYIFIRTRKPTNVLEVGFASGVSSTVIARALEMNGSGCLYTGDLNSNPSHKWIIPGFKEYIEKGIIKPTYPIDGVEFVKQLDSSIQIDITFSDASHEKDFCEALAVELFKKYPNALHLYHEYSFSPLSNSKFKEYISIIENLNHQRLYEREAFEDVFDHSQYEHYGFYGSCGLGVVKKRTEELNIKVYYRLSNLEAGISKSKIPNATKKHCLENCIKEFGADNITIIGDKLNNETKEVVNLLNLKLIEVENGNGSGTFRDALNLAVKENEDDDLIYLLEDDFLHRPNSKKYLIEGLTKYNAYITLYDHPDKYIDKTDGGNPFIEDKGEITRLIKTKSIHWKITNSTVMSFAAKVSRLKEDYDLLIKYSSGRITDSFGLFVELSNSKSIPVLSSIPGIATHVESKWLSPFTNWEEI